MSDQKAQKLLLSNGQVVYFVNNMVLRGVHLPRHLSWYGGNLVSVKEEGVSVVARQVDERNDDLILRDVCYIASRPEVEDEVGFLTNKAMQFVLAAYKTKGEAAFSGKI